MNPTARTHKVSLGRRIVSWFMLLFLLLISGLGVLAVLGPPRFVMSELLSDLEDRGVYLEVDQTGYRLHRGIILKSVRVFTHRDRVTPLVTADQVHVRMGWRRWLRNRVWSAKITFHGGALQTELGLWADDLVTSQLLEARAIRGHVRVHPGMVEIHGVEGRLSDLHIRVEGDVPIGPLEGAEPSDSDWVPPAMRVLADVISRVEEFRFAPLAEVEVLLRPSRFPGERVDVTASLAFSGTGSHRGFSLTEVEAEAQYEERQLYVPFARLKGEEDHVLEAGAHLDFRKKLASLRLQNTLPRYAVEHLSPIPLSELLERISVRVEGQAHVDLRFGPSAFEHFGDRVSGTMHVRDAFYRDAFFPEIRVDVSYEDRVFHLENVRGTVGNIDQRGPVSGSFRFDLETQAFRLEARTGFAPQAVLSLVPMEDVQEILAEWDFVGLPPQISVFVSRETSDASLEVDFSLRGEDLVSRGISLDELSLEVKVRGRTLTVPRLFARREILNMTGEAQWDLDQNHVTFAVDSTLPVDDLAVWVDPGLADLLIPYRIRGGSRLEAAGQLDFSGAHRHQLNAHVELKDVRWKWQRFDGIRFVVDLQGTALEIGEIWGRVGDGGFGGHVRVENLFTPDAFFTLRLKGQGLDLSEMIIAATDTEATPYTGRLEFEADVTGALEDRPEQLKFDSYSGKGRVEIQEGELFRIPLLLGLSRILGRVFRGFGYASQTDFSASFDIHEGRVYSKDLFLSGRMISIEGDGWLDFDKQVRANLRVQAFRSGTLVEAINLFLWPLRKLIEVRLSGTLDQPDWQLRNLP